ncbi:ABC transporter permease [Corynebacterium sp. sy017]|uniref:ABC transporter permease n=1 Tax=unclassified Corynebacterium TaxID=2624378 RepID=UPI001185A124|nr:MULTISPECIES: FtsX-like permease family protein [unclassified Corynebacterium]MBP3088360.1 ABC transporter permease [Corynebacterium sp. sy017]TSD91676.1 ABC transporter permease [Corynebacterium sp. SY003]
MLRNGIIFILALLLGILGSFMAWAITWSLENRSAGVYGFTQDSALLVVAEPGAATHTDANIVQRLTEVLAEHDSALIMDSDGADIAGLGVIDPHGVLGWLPEDHKLAIPGEQKQIYLYTDNYCKAEYDKHGSCALVPSGSSIEGAIPKPVANSMYEQYLYVPAAHDPILKGKFLLTHAEESLVTQVGTILLNDGYAVALVPARSIWESLKDDSTVLASLLLFAAGIFFLALYWKTRMELVRKELVVRISTGAKKWQLIRQFTRRQLYAIVPGYLVGAYLFPVLITGISDSDVPAGMFQVIMGTCALGILCAVVVYVGVFSLFLHDKRGVIR